MTLRLPSVSAAALARRARAADVSQGAYVAGLIDGMGAIAAHFRYISKNGRLAIGGRR